MVGIRQFQFEAGLIYRIAPVVTRYVPVKFIPLAEAAEVVANQIADLIMIAPWLQNVTGAANTHGQRFHGLIQTE